MTRLTLDTDRQVFFYEQDHYYLSNFSAFQLRWQDLTFQTSEAAYQWMKFHFPLAQKTERKTIQTSIWAAPSAHEAFKIAEANRALVYLGWDDVKVIHMREILRAKVNQHEYVRSKLLQTGAAELIENSWRDGYWGWGENRQGRNVLGKLWMEIREELRS